MRRWLFVCLALLAPGCSGTVDSADTPLRNLCLEACAHIRAKNCFEKPAISVDQCSTECSDLQSIAGNACTDEQAALFECTAKADITCEGTNGESPVVNGCDAQRTAAEMCQSPGVLCNRSAGSDDVCFEFGLKQFFVCAQGTFPGPTCISLTSTAWCCP